METDLKGVRLPVIMKTYENFPMEGNKSDIKLRNLGADNISLTQLKSSVSTIGQPHERSCWQVVTKENGNPFSEKMDIRNCSLFHFTGRSYCGGMLLKILFEPKPAHVSYPRIYHKHSYPVAIGSGGTEEKALFQIASI